MHSTHGSRVLPSAFRSLRLDRREPVGSVLIYVASRHARVLRSFRVTRTLVRSPYSSTKPLKQEKTRSHARILYACRQIAFMSVSNQPLFILPARASSRIFGFLSCPRSAIGCGTHVRSLSESAFGARVLLFCIQNAGCIQHGVLSSENTLRLSRKRGHLSRASFRNT